MKSCFNCSNACISEGFPASLEEPGEPASAECYCDAPGFPAHLYENVFSWNCNNLNAKIPEDVLPSLCGHYKAIMVRECGHCKKLIDKPLHSWQIYGTGFEAVPCCSCKCAELLTAKFNAEMGIVS
jgi:hypothetical protein